MSCESYAAKWWDHYKQDLHDEVTGDGLISNALAAGLHAIGDAAGAAGGQVESAIQSGYNDAVDALEVYLGAIENGAQGVANAAVSILMSKFLQSAQSSIANYVNTARAAALEALDAAEAARDAALAIKNAAEIAKQVAQAAEQTAQQVADQASAEALAAEQAAQQASATAQTAEDIAEAQRLWDIANTARAAATAAADALSAAASAALDAAAAFGSASGALDVAQAAATAAGEAWSISEASLAIISTAGATAISAAVSILAPAIATVSAIAMAEATGQTARELGHDILNDPIGTINGQCPDDPPKPPQGPDKSPIPPGGGGPGGGSGGHRNNPLPPPPQNPPPGPPTYQDPLVFALDGAAVQLVGVASSGAYFDYTGSGTNVHTGWVGPNSGILVTNPADGATVTAADVVGAISGSAYADLAAMDSNHDGVITPADAAWNSLRMWVDTNLDGQSDGFELRTLGALGITSISLATTSDGSSVDGNVVMQRGTFVMNGVQSGTAEVNFATDRLNVNLTQFDNLADTIDWTLLPELDGYGYLPHMSIAVCADNDLANMAKSLVVNSSDLTAAEFDSQFEAILFKWAGASDIDPGSRGQYIDARHLAVVYAYYGIDPSDSYYSQNPNWHNGPTVWEPRYQMIKESYELRFVSQIATSLINYGADQQYLFGNPYFPFAFLSYNPETNRFDGKIEDVVAVLSETVPTDPAAAAQYLQIVVPLLTYTKLEYAVSDQPAYVAHLLDVANQSVLSHDGFAQLATDLGYNWVSNGSGTSGADYVEGTAVADTLNGGDGSDLIVARAGNDTINGGNGNDLIVGGAGNDTIVESGGDDTYIWNLGDGDDTITGGSWNDGVDTIQFGAGISASDLVYSVANNGNGLKIGIAGQPGSITIDYELNYDTQSQIDQLKFADGTILTRQQFINAALAQLATAGDDTLYGGNGADTINGGSGNDTIYAGGGNDVVTGGAGNDTIYESGGDDTYVWNLGDGDDLITGGSWQDGVDTIQFGSGIAAFDLVYSFANGGNGLTIRVAGQQGSITIDYELNYDTQSLIDQLKFADGTVLTRQQFVNAALAQLATSGNDTLYGSNGDDTINGGAGIDTIYAGGGNDIVTGGAGNDTLVESGGDDTYIWNLGDGDDLITGGSWHDGIDTIQFGSGISASSLVYSFANSGNGLKISVAGQPGSITIDYELNYDTQSQIDQLKFADGTVLTRQQFINAALAQLATSGNDTLYGSSGDDTINGGGGNDTIYAGGGNDIVTGGAGNDTLVESGGDDTYVWNLGDGDDVITGTSWRDGFDTIQLGSGITTSNLAIAVAPDARSMKLSVNGQLGSITIIDYLLGGAPQGIDQIKFADGTIWDRTTIQSKLNSVQSTSGDDVINGTAGNDTIYGLGGNDAINPGGGNDLVIGGPGNDTIYESGQDDTYVWNLGDGDDLITGGSWLDGFDTIQFGGGISASDLVYSFVNGGQGLKISISGQPGSITMDYELNYDTQSLIDQFRFADGTVLSRQQFVNAALAQLATAGNDTLFGSNGNDTINGGAGNDIINPGGGNDLVTGGLGNDTINESGGDDTYFWNLGDGDDLITGGSWRDGVDTIQFGPGITASNLVYSFANAGQGLKIGIAGQPGSITMDYELNYDTQSLIDQLKFADGTILTRQQFVNAALAQLATAGNDTLYGSNGDDTINGGAGDDILNPGGGNDLVTGGLGNDTINESGGDDTYFWNLGDGDDLITGGSWRDGVDTIQFGPGISASNLVYSFANAGQGLKISIAGQTGSITMDYELNYDTQSLIDQLRFADGTVLSRQQFVNAALAQLATSGNDTLYGSNGDDTINGGAGNDTIYAAGGNDIVTGGTGNDTIYEGGGDDTYIWNLGDGDDLITGGSWRDGVDTLQFGPGITASSLVYAYANGFNGLKISIAGQPGSITLDYALSFEQQSLIDQLKFADGTILTRQQYINAALAQLATAGNDTLYGGSGDDIINGGGGNDTINGLAGNDTIDGGDGNDVMDGSSGVDTLSYASASAGVTLNLSVTTAQNTIGAGTDTATGFENLTGSAFNDTLTGDANANTILGGAGNDVINGGAGNDIVEGGLGDDLLDGGAGVDTLSYASATAGVTANLSITTAQNTIAAGNDTITGFENLAGSSFDDTLTGDASANTISGGAGNDTIDGGAGNDVLDGGLGTDTLSYASGTAGVTVNLANAAAQNTIGAGTDTVTGFENLTGSAFNDTLTGDANANMIMGGAGDDNISGGAGNDVIDGGAGNDLLDGSTGTDTVSYASAASAVTVSLATTTAQNTVGAGTDTLTGFENLTGSAFDDTLTGDANANVISGGAGNDTIDGGAGNDVLDGGAGTDTLSYASSTAAVIVSLAVTTAQNTGGAGTDTITGFENLTGSVNNDTLTGDGNANMISGGAGNDIIDGGAGNDVLDGGAGTDTLSYASAAAGVTVTLASAAAQNTVGAGTDTVTGFENLTGSAFNDTLTGDANANTISGGAGNDTIEGGAGDDVLDGGAGTDTLSYAAATAGVAVSLATAAAQNTVGAGNDTITGFENLTGSAFNDTLTGDANANTISGGAGNDTIDGGAGNDILDGGSGVDTLSYASATAGITVSLATTTAQSTVGAGTDTVTGFENLTGSAFADTLTGDGNANTIIGGAGNDTINGGLGDDLLDGGAGDDSITGGTGIDTVTYASATAGVTVNLSTTKAQNTIGAGTDTLATIENIIGSSFNDTLTGTTGDNVMSGGAGNDTIDGASGNDTIDGGDGNDTLIGNTGTDTVTYASATSAVTVNLALTAAQNTVGAGLDTLSGFENLTGSNFNDTLTGDANANTITGGSGNDTLTGGAGIDTFAFHAGFGMDVITDFAATGTSHDLIQVDTSMFADWAHLLGATQQVGADLMITLDANDTIVLRNVALANFTSSDVKFV